MKTAVAVIDIGMTNKKVAVYDLDLTPLESDKRVFAPHIVQGLPTHNLPAMERWFLDSLRSFAKKYDIRAIAVSTHGATLVCVDDKGNPVAPCIYYTHEPVTGFHDRFFAAAGKPEALQAITGTPNFSALINPAKGLFFLREKFPEEYGRATSVLPYPQYWGMRLTGKAGAEGTYIGCHTYLWDWTQEKYSSVATILDVAHKLPQHLQDSWSTLGTIRAEIAAYTGLSRNTIVSMGIHDSNASLLPYLIKKGSTDFVLNSTGSWCVIMHPQKTFGFLPQELGKVVFFNRSAYNRPIKTAIFTGGLEYEAWAGLIAETAKIKNGAHNGNAEKTIFPDPGAAVYSEILAEKNIFILPELVPGSGQFPGSRPRAVEGNKSFAFADIESGAAVPEFMRTPARAMAALNLSLVIQTLVALERAGLKENTDVYIEGGFRNNIEYTSLLAAALPKNSVYLTDMAEATSLGAAMTALAALQKTSPDALADQFDIASLQVTPMAGISVFDAYKNAWLSCVEKNVQ